MAYFDKKWSQLSGDESRAMKEKYGSRRAWQAAKAKAQSHQSGNSSTATSGANATSNTATTSTANSSSSAKSSYGSNTDWSKLTKSGTVRDEVKNDARLQEMVRDPHDGKMKNKYAVKYSSGNIIRNPAVHDLQSVQRVQRKEAERAVARAPKPQDLAAQEREKRAYAYQDFAADFNKYQKNGPGQLERAVNQRDHYQHLKNTNGSYSNNEDENSAVERLMSTGQKFDRLDVKREMGSATNTDDGLYKYYGGRENYLENHSVGSGNWQSRIPQDQLGTVKEADDLQRQYFTRRKEYFDSPDFMKRFGQYDFAQNQKDQIVSNANQNIQGLDDRENRMAGNRYASIYGF